MSGSQTALRLFFALSLPEATRVSVAGLLAQAKAAQPAGRGTGPRVDPKWVQPDHLHLTLKFVGAIAAERLDGFRAVLEQSASRGTPVALRGRLVTGFRKLTDARVVALELWPDGPLATLAAELDRACAELGIARERRPFRPHITLARLREAGDVSWLSFLDATTVDGTVDQVTLFRSDLGRGGPAHTALAVAPLGRIRAS